ncbi:hypothetical protein CAMGR0001_1327 [Campylobacter gracilis RM3268]|uniref:Uncharacterized protein n=1 Tax=Campylobacter gracilis RM3268 TaxID=553220 RepID=C8PJC8_9BACT|nr:hypothetical protein CAMGR0001_1327 [Campylobacter gracilis RM3268]
MVPSLRGRSLNLEKGGLIKFYFLQVALELKTNSRGLFVSAARPACGNDRFVNATRNL